MPGFLIFTPMPSRLLLSARLRVPLFLLIAAASGPAEAALPPFNEILSAITLTETKSTTLTPAEFYARCDAYEAKSDGMSPEAAAAGWLALAEDYARVPPAEWGSDSPWGYDSTRFRALVRVLPRGEAWPALAAVIRRRPVTPKDRLAKPLALVAAGLSPESPESRALLTRFKDESISTNRDPLSAGPDMIRRFYAENSPEWRELMKAEWRESLAGLERPRGEFEWRSDREYLGEIPDLVTLFGEAEATRMLTRVLSSGRSIEVSEVRGEATRALLTKLAVAAAETMPQPAWFAVTPEAPPVLFETLSRRFPLNREAAGALAAYVEGRHAAGELVPVIERVRTDKGFSDMMSSALSYLDNNRVSPAEFFDLALACVQANPGAVKVEKMQKLAALAGRTAEWSAWVRTALASPDLPPHARAEYEDALTRAMLADDRVEEASARLLAQLAEPISEGQVAASGREVGDPIDRRVRAALTLWCLGDATGHPEWCARAVAAVEALETAYPEAAPDQSGIFYAMVPDLDLRAARVARRLLTMSNDPARANHDGSEELVVLFDAYARAGRHADAIAVLERAPQWGVSDLAELPDYAFDAARRARLAESLAALGRRDEALRVLDVSLEASPGSDALYQVLLAQLGPTESFLNRMEALCAANRFEERPLIWKASVLPAQGRLDEAERAVRAAIAIDPSDGEQGKGDRMRAYAVLADILEKKGDAESAAVYRGAVEAIRIGETADGLYEAGLLKRALARYEESLTKFADAYCVQSRLALRYLEAGDTEKAAQHYERAFELMPDSFGRVESHCFGCEGAFEGPLAQGVAERVFGAFLAKNPDHPRARYLMGYLRESQGRKEEAAAEYRRAVALDPDYLNAWVKLGDILPAVAPVPGESERCTDALRRLNPRASLPTPRVRTAADWDRARAADRTRPASLFPLKASAAKLASAPGARRPSRRFDRGARAELMENPWFALAVTEAERRH